MEYWNIGVLGILLIRDEAEAELMPALSVQRSSFQ
jgi:hypothetical protein